MLPTKGSAENNTELGVFDSLMLFNKYKDMQAKFSDSPGFGSVSREHTDSRTLETVKAGLH